MVTPSTACWHAVQSIQEVYRCLTLQQRLACQRMSQDTRSAQDAPVADLPTIHPARDRVLVLDWRSGPMIRVSSLLHCTGLPSTLALHAERAVPQMTELSAGAGRKT